MQTNQVTLSKQTFNNHLKALETFFRANLEIEDMVDEVFVFDNTHEFAKWLVEKTEPERKYKFDGDLSDI